MKEQKEVSIIAQVKGQTMYWNSVLERWDKDEVILCQWKADEIFQHVKEQNPELEIEIR